MNLRGRVQPSEVVSELSRVRAANREARFVGVRLDLAFDPEVLLDAAPMEPTVGWSFEGELVLGFGVTWRLTADPAERIASLMRETARFYGELAGSASPRLFGGLTFESDQVDPRWPELGVGAFLVPRFRFQSSDGARFVEIVVEVTALDDPDESAALVRDLEAMWSALEGRGRDRSNEPSREPPVEVRLDESRGADYRLAVTRALAAIAAREVEKVVVGQHREAAGRRPPRRAFEAALREEAHARFLVRLGDGCFVGATPELLVRATKGALAAQAVAGSRRVGDPASDPTAKEIREHALVADFIADRLATLGGDVSRRDREMRRFGSVEHFITPFDGEAARPILEIVGALHPTPALAGAPVPEASRLLRRLEGHARGPFGAPFGWVDGEGGGHFVVGIRSVLLATDRAWLFAGAGIVAGSDAFAEWEETELKLSVARRLLTSNPKARSSGASPQEVTP